MAKAKSRAAVEIWRPPVVAEVVGEGLRVWGGGQFNNEEFREALVFLVANGEGLKKAVESLEKYGKAPAMWLIGKWMREVQGFREAYDAALEIRGHLLVEDALDAVLLANDKESAAVAKVQADQLRWMASKFTRKFTDRKIVEEEHTNKMSDADIENKIKALLNDPEVRGALGEAKQILDAEFEEEGTNSQ